MRILIAHNRYRERGGEDTAVDTEAALLERAGHEVERFFVTNDGIAGIGAKLRTVAEILENRSVSDALAATIDRFSPDIVHFHNTFPRLAPGAVLRSLERGVTTIQTIHNFRLICAGAMLLRDGRPCEKCIGASRWPGVRHRCYRGSALGSSVVALAGRRFRQIHDGHPQSHTLIALTEFAKSKLAADGYDPARIAVKGNTTRDPGRGPQMRDRRLVFLGRLSPERGVAFLLRVARGLNAEIEIIGNGPERARLEGTAGRSVTFAGPLPHEAAMERIKRAAAVLVPSQWYECFPMVIPEAMATATPLLVSALGALPELVEDGVSGRVLPPHDLDAWIGAAAALIDDPALVRRLGEGARRAFEARFDEQRNVTELLAIYDAALARHGAKGRLEHVPIRKDPFLRHPSVSGVPSTTGFPLSRE
jgi:glycosyltransferase involved in cell wall biosynthesis